MERLFRSAYNDDLGNSSRGLEDVGHQVHNHHHNDLAGGVGTSAIHGDIIGNLDGQNETSNLNDEEWFHQFRVSYDQNNQSLIEQSRSIHRAQGELDFSKRGMRLEDSHEKQAQHLLMPRAQSIDGLNQLQGVDNMTALNNLLQQQHQQQNHPSLSNNPNQATAVSMASTQSLEQQLAALQQQLHNQESESTQRHAQETQPMATATLHENLIQLQKLQEQQHQILKNISQNTGLVDPSSLMNPLGTLLSSLVGQTSSNNGNDTGNESIHNRRNDLSNAMTHDRNDSSALPWRQMNGRQELHLANTPLQSPAGMIPVTHPTIQERDPHQNKRTSFVETNNAPLEAPQPLRLPPTSIRAKEQRKRFVSDHSMNSASSKRAVTRDHSTNTNINIEFPTPPIIRKTDSRKKLKPRSFPLQLWDAMMAKNPKKDEAFEWLPDGKSFVVVDPDLFCKEILDPRFKQSKYGSFVRKLHRWGFIRLTSGTGTDCFHHPLFQKLKPELVSQIKCNNRKDNKKGHNAYARGEYQDSVQPSLMGVEKFIRTKGVVSTDDAEDRPF